MAVGRRGRGCGFRECLHFLDADAWRIRGAPGRGAVAGGLAAFEVETVEALGADHLIHGVLLGQNVVFRVDNHMYIPEVGIRAGLEFSAEHVYWFDPETTKRIRL